MTLTRDDSFEEMGSSWLCLEIARLDAVLRDNGVADPAVRRQIVTLYFSDAGTFLDQGWLVSEGKRVYPHVAFTDRPLQPQSAPGDVGDVFLPSCFFSFAEYANTNAFHFFQENPNVANEIEKGVIGEES